MVKGVKKIKWSGVGIVKSNLSTPNKKVVIAPDQHVFFEVEKWYDATTEADKKKTLTWIFQDQKAKTIVLQKTLPSNNQYGIKLPKNLCGPFEYYLEASLSGKRDTINKTGLLISGYCTPKIVSSKWSTTNDGKDVRKEHLFKYGETVHLNLKTEGLNGNLNLSVDVFRKSEESKTPLYRYTSVDVIDGEINLAIKNTFVWFGKLKGIKETEEFYVKVFDPAHKLYISNAKNETGHARFLKINKKIVSQETKPPTNLSPLKTGEPDKNAARFEPCKFETITIIEDKKEDGKTTKINALVFDNGKKLVNKTPKKEPLKKTILFEFEKYDITPEAKTILNNTLQFLLEHQFSSIKIDGHACVIGKEQYNQKLSQQRSDAVKKAFVDGGLEASRIISIGRGEVNPTDDKQGRDNLKYRDEKEYKQNRSVVIAFDYYGHDAQTIIYETIAPSKDKNITIDITEYQNKACFREKGKHKKNIKINSTEYPKAIDQVTSKLDFPIRSNLAWWNNAPIQYIWPKVLANEYDIHIHSCRYFANESNPTIKAMVYSDIKWNLQLSYNWEHPFAYTHGNLPEYSRKNPKDPKVAEIIRDKRKAQSKAVGAGKEAKRVANSPEMLTKFELKLEGKWGGQSFELSGEFAKKIRTVLNVFIKYKEMADKVKNTLGGIPKGVTLSKTPFMFEIQSPSLNANIDWYLEKGTGINAAKVATVGKLNFKADPLIGAEFTLDLLGLVSKMNPVVAAFVGSLEGVLSAANGGIKLEAKFTGSLNFDFNAIEFNSLTGIVKGGSLDLGAKLQIKIEMTIHASIKSESYAKEPILELHAAGKLDAYFAAKIKMDSDEKGIYYQPEVGFSGMIFTFEIEIVIRGHKVVRKFSNENEPFLKPEPYQGEKHYLPLNNKKDVASAPSTGSGGGW
ncbi:OmpA family protein [Flavobacterium sp. Fl-77]|uniref:OmpA family protein n=1 Tax=Flavobacterium flavipigmentatum TaxID=2893884 RepID=A0AAJ2VW05_9FLAO|nr:MULTISPECIES: OmpA family protein [unclassified Flavobacterium]MDX6181062.1 OmpA family protein [Flavobacterium sp. Fl-33]MDX6184663.1 OmpA family protein [Flavobacterium sp. Fl-77]UFH39765.1 OmpA family protein [Flavobacterium sp. F-70]